MIYLNSAATSYPKPDCVLAAAAQAAAAVPQSQYRSFSPEGMKADDIMAVCRRNLAKLLHIAAPERIFFTSGATESLNQAIYGITEAYPKISIVTTVTEHNSVLRALYNLPSAACCPVKIIPCSPFGQVEPSDAEAAMGAMSTRPGTPSSVKGAFILNHCSNVTGAVQDLTAMGKIAKKHGFLFIVDSSQSAGCLPVDVEEAGIDLLVFTGHKSLLGLQGTGGFYLAPGLSLPPLKFGGTGSHSDLLHYEPDSYDYETGTQNLPGIAALNAGVEYILERGVDSICLQERQLIELLYSGLVKLPSVKVYGSCSMNHGPLLSFNVNGLSPSDTAYILYNSYGILVRTGLQCAPLIHRYLGCPREGCVRVSVSDASTMQDISALLKAINDIVKSCR